MKALIAIAHGSESLETITTANILRRGGVEVTLASIESTPNVLGTRDIRLVADALFSDAGRKDYDMIVLPGGEKGAAARPYRLFRFPTGSATATAVVRSWSELQETLRTDSRYQHAVAC